MTKSRRARRHGRSLRHEGAPVVPRPPCVLIVTEGKVTEKEYFQHLAEELGLGGQRVTVTSSKGASPMQVVDRARKRLDREEAFDYVYCVFDRDTHANYDEAVSRVQRMAKDSGAAEKIEAITSVPCFEYWCYLHVGDSAAPYSGADSPCRSLTKELTKHVPFKSYKKSKGWMSANFKKLAVNRSEAIKRAKRVLSQAQKAGSKAHSEDPSTRVHIVVESLKKISALGKDQGHSQ